MENITESSSKKRQLEDIDKILSLAKINVNDLHSISQTIYFAEASTSSHNLRLLELNQHLQECFTKGESVFIKGEADENVVICTESRTYDVVARETSNSLLLTNKLLFDDEIKDSASRISSIMVKGLIYEYLEVIPTKPQFKKLNNLLNETEYKGPEYERLLERKLYTYDELLNIVQASKIQLDNALSSMCCAIIHNKVRKLCFEYHFRVLSQMLNIPDEYGWGHDEIDYTETMNLLEKLIPFPVLDTVFNFYAEESKLVDGMQLYCYKEREVCRLFASVLLQSSGKFNLDDFLEAWQQSVPAGMIASEEMLYGIALVDRKSVPNVIKSFKEDTLPDNIIDRFKVLFVNKSKWTVEEIAPYIERLATENCDTSAMLAKHARMSTTNAVKYYSSKHAN